MAENLCLIDRRARARATFFRAPAMPRRPPGMRVRYFTAADLIESLYRGLANNSVARIVDSVLRADPVMVDELSLAPSTC